MLYNYCMAYAGIIFYFNAIVSKDNLSLNLQQIMILNKTKYIGTYSHDTK